MYCKKCGSELEIENQRFCQICGTEIRRYHNNSQLGSMRDLNKSSSAPPPQYQDIRQPHINKRSGGPYSKRCLGFGIVSLIVAIISFNIGSSLILDNTYFYIQEGIVFIGLTIARIIGLMFGVVNRLSYSKAISMETESSILKAGNILGILGISFNSLLILISLFMI